ncbi:MAG: hypothetical protein ACTSX6_04560 [Candidatus Heimdallarchaeaceae archaeon]
MSLKETSNLTANNQCLYILIPNNIKTDSNFNFKAGDKVDIEVKGNTIIVKKASGK